VSIPTRASAAELRDIALVLDSHEGRLDEGDEKFSEYDRAFATTHQEIETLKNEVIILRDGMSAYCNRVRDDVSSYCNRVIERFDRALAKLPKNGH